ncbi:MAG TPA: hypothetical protein VNZ01_05635 [Solirubrobacteraceae bacterium]|jgi:hypothetical protein|nr:hypothetical protein [Solirubrobacteraceae bacterium]
MKSSRPSRPPLAALLVAITLALAVGPLAAMAHGEGASTARWQLEQPTPPERTAGESLTPIGLGKIGDLEFLAPNLGLLITSGNPPTIPPGVWVYNGVRWRELANVCGASDGRIAWAGPAEFWTISDGRPGQAASETGQIPPLEDNTLCHFAGGQVAGSYASLAFQPSSYRAMHAAGCLSPQDCWFGGDPVTHVGAFHLHWNGSSVIAEPNPQGRPVQDMRAYGNSLYESVRIKPPEGGTHEEEEQLTPPETRLTPSTMHLIFPEGQRSSSGSPFASLSPGVPVYSEEEPPWALEAMHLGAGEGALWGAANPLARSQFPPGSELPSGEVTIVRDAGGAWSQVLGAGSDPPGGNPFTKFSGERERENELVTSLAAEPGTEDAWLGITSPANSSHGALANATVARISRAGVVSEQQPLPSTHETEAGVGPKGAADKIACPAPNDCWLATTQGWLFHLTDGTPLPENTDPAFAHLITYRPPDQGVPQIAPDAPPPDNSGLLGEPSPIGGTLPEGPARNEAKVTVPLVSGIHARLVHGTTLELRFHLAVKARVRLIARRHKAIVASTPMRTLAGGSRRLLLRLDPRRWPTKLDLQTRALAALPTLSSREPGVSTVSTSLRFPTWEPAGSGPLR